VAPGIPVAGSGAVPGGVWSPISSTLIYGRADAVLVDALMTVDQAKALGDWDRGARAQSDDDLRDPRSRRPPLRGERPPRALSSSARRRLARRGRADAPANLPAAARCVLEGPVSGTDPEPVVVADELEGSVFHLEGHELRVVPLGHTDMDDTTCLHVPSIGLVVAGDAAYNGVHQYSARPTPPADASGWRRSTRSESLDRAR